MVDGSPLAVLTNSGHRLRISQHLLSLCYGLHSLNRHHHSDSLAVIADRHRTISRLLNNGGEILLGCLNCVRIGHP